MEALDNFLGYSYRRNYLETTKRQLPIDEGYKKFLKFSLEGDTIEVPLITRELAMISSKNGYKSLIIPLVETHRFVERRTASRILKDFYNQGRYCELVGVKSNKGDKYYGMPGLICDENLHILVLCTCIIDVKRLPNGGVLGTLKRINVHIDYSVLSNTDRMLEKTFYRQFLPNIKNTIIYPGDFAISDYLSNNEVETCPTIIIGDVDATFAGSPEIPNPSVDFEKKINEAFKMVVNEL